MDQQTCLLQPSHFTYFGVCFPGNNASVVLSNPNAPQPVNFQVGTTTAVSAPEMNFNDPGTAIAFIVGCVLILLAKRRFQSR